MKIDKLFINGNIITLNDRNDIVEAVAIESGKIVKVGKREELMKLINENTIVQDLNGSTMIPGFFDAHSHFYQTGLRYSTEANLNSPFIGTVKSIEDIIDILKEWAEKTAEGNLVKGYGYDDTSVIEKRRVNRDDLDRVSTKHPIIIRHISGHLHGCNTLGLELLGIKEDTPNPPDGIYERDQNGRLTGVIEEALDPINVVLASVSAEQEFNAVKLANEVYSKVGITTASTGATRTMREVELIKSGQNKGDVKIRVILNRAEVVYDGCEKFDGFDNKLYKGCVKTFQDGSIQGYTGYLSQPYYIQPEGQEDYRGYPIRPKEELMKLVEKYHKLGEQVFIHCNGDEAIQDVIDSYINAQEKYPREDPRHVCIHAQMSREDQLDKMKEYGIMPSFFVLHTYYWGDRHRDIFMGPERAKNMSPLKSALDRSITFTIHCDTPVVPQEPLRCIWSAVNRLSATGKTIGEEQRVDVLDALKAYTINSAYQYKLEDVLGSIEVGKYADFAILS